MKPGVYIAQMLCPVRHAYMAAVGWCETNEDVSALGAALIARFDDWCAKGIALRECKLCKSADFHVETARTGFSTVEEAMPDLKASEARQRWTAAQWKAGRN